MTGIPTTHDIDGREYLRLSFGWSEDPSEVLDQVAAVSAEGILVPHLVRLNGDFTTAYRAFPISQISGALGVEVPTQDQPTE